MHLPTGAPWTSHERNLLARLILVGDGPQRPPPGGRDPKIICPGGQFRKKSYTFSRNIVESLA